ncbi:MAG: O-acetyl-ADP-ribose deacetylase [Clostridia bacterium]|nr:O-acetyl-ADP-ribose deacetylase [Clostridia bacterium]
MSTSSGKGPIGPQPQPPCSCDRVSVVRGDITEQHVDAIVNAANTTLFGEGGVDGAIHRAAGPELLAECRAIGGCNTGDAVITRGYRLPAKYVIHTVGPIWQGGSAGKADLLAACYRNSLILAAKHGVRTLAFPSISTGAYHYPLEQASQIAMRTVTRHLEVDPSIDEVIFVCFNERTRDAYQRALDAELPIR